MLVRIFLLGALLLGILDAHAASCTAHRVSVTANAALNPTVGTLARAELNRRMFGFAPARMNRGVVQGLTEARSEYAYELTLTETVSPRSGKPCFSAQVQVDMTYVDVAVFIARELEPNSCGDHLVRKHEMAHVQVYRNNRASAPRAVAGALQSALRGQAFTGRTPAEARRAAEEGLAREIASAVRAHVAKTRPLHAQLDATDNLDEARVACERERSNS